MKLELKHLAPYLPYNISMLRINKLGEWKIIKLSCGNIGDVIEDVQRYKLILRSISDFKPSNFASIQSYKLDISLDQQLNWQIEDDEDYYPSGYYEIPKNIWMGNYEKLFQEHLDVFGLIDAGLAIDINTLENEKN